MKKHAVTKSTLFFVYLTGLIFFTPQFTYAYDITPVIHLFDLEADFLQPSDAAVGKDNRIYVMDGVNNLVKVFDEKGTYIFTFGGKGSSDGHFNSPLGITTDSQGYVYVADTGNHRVQVFNSFGKLHAIFEVKSQKGERPSDPVDLAVDEKRKRLYVVDNDNHRIMVYSLTDFRFLESWGSEGEGMQEFRNPFFINVGQDTSVLVVDVLNTRVQVWSPKGQAVGSIGEYGVDIGQLYRPKGVCVDRDNNVFVSDSYVGAIQVFNRYGNFKSVVGDESGNVLHWTTPVGITIDDSQRLYVVEMLANRVKVYKIINESKRSKK
jgi:DNA-binding beta-propeller fold protein YncE